MNAPAPLSTEADWTFDLLQDYEREIARIADNFGLDTSPTRLRLSVQSR